MKKDTVYIDIEDDITAIIEKVQASSTRVIALVPPKRTEVLQSVVNLKLLQRSAKESNKRIVLVTNHSVLKSLAGGVGIHVAKDLHSKPVVPNGPNLKEEELVIGEDHAVITDGLPSEATKDAEDSSDKSEKSDSNQKSSKKAAKTAAKKSKSAKKSINIPNFDRFRNKIFIGFAVIILLIAGWWVAFVKMPSAKIAIKAQTSRIETKQAVTIDASLSKTDIENFKIAATSKELKKTVTKQFSATGEKDIGEKSVGTVTIQNCDSSEGITVPAGTGFSANDLTFISSAAVVVPGGLFSGGGCDAAGVADVAVIAQSAGDQYNLTAGTAYSIANQGAFVAGIGGQMSGGTTKVAKVVSQTDIDRASAEIKADNEAEVKAELKALFSDKQHVIDATFTMKKAQPKATPKADAEADKGSVSIVFTYTQMAISNSDVEAILMANQSAQFDEDRQAVYNNGLDGAIFKLDKKDSAGKQFLTLRTSAFIGPKIDVVKLAESIAGKRYSEVVEIVKQSPGVTDVDVELAPFWVFSAPKNTEKIDIELDVSEHTLQ